MREKRLRKSSREGRPLNSERRRTGATGGGLPRDGDVKTLSPLMRQLFVKAARLAPQQTSVLITGETGVGKERLARWLHHHSARAHRRFVRVNCSGLPDAVAHPYLFGHGRGVCRGAMRASAGLFEVASGGTLFLDEIGDLSSTLQAKLLRVLEERGVHRVGEWRLRPIDVRLIAASNRPLQDAIVHGQFRRDLFLRLCVVGLHIPPLRERPEDLALLAGDLLERAATRLHRTVGGYAPEAWACLLQHDWPGNVRELENAITEACLVTEDSTIRLQDLPDSVRSGSRFHASASGDRTSLVDLEHAYIDAVLTRHQGNRQKAIDELGISLATLKRRLRRWRLHTEPIPGHGRHHV